MLTPETLPRLQEALVEADIDGWLVYDFQGANPIAAGLLGLKGMLTRRIFVWLPREGVPVAITHNIEQSAWDHWPDAWGHERYSSWRELEGLLDETVSGRRVAMEYSPGDAVPYLDRVPGGVLDMVRAAGAGEIVSSAALVTRFYAVWTPEQLASHRRAAEIVRSVALESFQLAASRARGGTPITEFELQAHILEAFDKHGLEEPDHGPIVAVDANAANPHYAPSADNPVPVVDGSILLIDLWAREPDGVFADQTWMASLGKPSDRAVEVWNTIRDARRCGTRSVMPAMRRSRSCASVCPTAPRSPEAKWTMRRAESSPPGASANTSRTAPAIPSTRAISTVPARTWITWRRERIGSSFPVSASPSSLECTSAARSACGRRSTRMSTTASW